jgi:hypothetical protein
MSVNASLQQIAGGVAAAFAGVIVTQKDKYSPLEHYDTIGYVIVVISMLSIFLLSRVNKLTKKRLANKKEVTKNEEIVAEITV